MAQTPQPGVAEGHNRDIPDSGKRGEECQTRRTLFGQKEAFQVAASLARSARQWGPTEVGMRQHSTILPTIVTIACHPPRMMLAGILLLHTVCLKRPVRVASCDEYGMVQAAPAMMLAESQKLPLPLGFYATLYTYVSHHCEPLGEHGEPPLPIPRYDNASKPSHHIQIPHIHSESRWDGHVDPSFVCFNVYACISLITQ
jgi:hypothetical protein